MAHSKSLSRLRWTVGIIGAGVAGLHQWHAQCSRWIFKCNAHLDSRGINLLVEPGPRARIYPGLHINKYDNNNNPFFFFFVNVHWLIDSFSLISVHGEHRFSPLEMSPPRECTEKCVCGGGFVSQVSFDMWNYMEKFTEKFLIGKANFHMETEAWSAAGTWNDVVVERFCLPNLLRDPIITFSRPLSYLINWSKSCLYNLFHISSSKGCSNPKNTGRTNMSNQPPRRRNFVSG